MLCLFVFRASCRVRADRCFARWIRCGCQCADSESCVGSRRLLASGVVCVCVWCACPLCVRVSCRARRAVRLRTAVGEAAEWAPRRDAAQQRHPRSEGRSKGPQRREDDETAEQRGGGSAQGDDQSTVPALAVSRLRAFLQRRKAMGAGGVWWLSRRCGRRMLVCCSGVLCALLRGGEVRTA